MQVISPLMGASFRPADVKEKIKLLEVSDELILERDPENEDDPNAIKFLDAEGEFLGFVAKEIAAEIADTLDGGAEATATVVGMTGTVKPHVQIEIEDFDPEDDE